jgi:hypothetical protein
MAGGPQNTLFIAHLAIVRFPFALKDLQALEKYEKAHLKSKSRRCA